MTEMAFGFRLTVGTEGEEFARLELEPEISAISALKKAGINPATTDEPQSKT